MIKSEVVKITELFKISGKLQSIDSYGSGHINKTYLSTWQDGGIQRKYIHQTINTAIFPDVEKLMLNISKVIEHINSKITDPNLYKKIVLIPAKDNKFYALDSEKKAWRTYKYIEDTKYIDFCSKKEQAGEAGRIVGFFQALLIDLDIRKINENIRKFTSAPHRVAELQAAIAANGPRNTAASKEIEFANTHASLTEIIESKIKSGDIPKRIVHGDTKINNILFSADDKAVCLVNLDTCMPGYSLYDFGDLVRSTAIAAAEDEQDFSKIKLNTDYFQAIVTGYLGQAKSFLNNFEKELLPIVPQLIALTLGIRFLTDYLNGDKYFTIKRELHNLERARTQFKVFETFKSNYDYMKSVVNSNI